MSDFEFLFALYGLMLGLSLAELLSGLARAIEERLSPGATLRIGWLTPLLAIFTPVLPHDPCCRCRPLFLSKRHAARRTDGPLCRDDFQRVV